MPEFDRLGSVWPSVTNPHPGLPPIPAQPLGEPTALRIALQVSGVMASEPVGALTSALARSSQTTNTSGVSTSGCGALSPVVGNRADWFLVFQSAARRLATSESAGLHSTGRSVPSRIAPADSSEPLPISLTRIRGLARWNSLVAASSQSFFSVEYSSVISTSAVGSAVGPGRGSVGPG